MDSNSDTLLNLGVLGGSLYWVAAHLWVMKHPTGLGVPLQIVVHDNFVCQFCTVVIAPLLESSLRTIENFHLVDFDTTMICLTFPLKFP